MGRTFQEEAGLNQQLYFNDHYFSTTQWMSFRSQIEGVRIFNPQTVLEIGVGNGFVSSILRNCGYSVTTMDINPGLKPDYTGSITDINNVFADKLFDVVLCAEVLEHLPFNLFLSCIQNIEKVSNMGAVITLPNAKRQVINIYGHIPKININIFWGLGVNKVPPEHHWEIDSKKETKLKNITRTMNKYFILEDIRRIEGNPYHMRFLLRK